jgi:hypothetical protein
MGYPKSIYAKVKPKMTKDEALEKAKAEKPKFRTKEQAFRSGKVANVIQTLTEILAEHPDATVSKQYYGGMRVVYKEQIPVEERAQYILANDRDRWYEDRYKAESKYDDAVWEAEQKARNAAVANTTARHCSCCACSKGL